MSKSVARTTDLQYAPAILSILSGGQVRRNGNEIQLLNPHRADRNYGSFSFNSDTGAWADFAAEVHGFGLDSIVAYLYNANYFDCTSSEQARMRSESRIRINSALKNQGSISIAEGQRFFVEQDKQFLEAHRRTKPELGNATEAIYALLKFVPSYVWHYTDQDNRVIFSVVRQDFDSGKVVRPYSYFVNKKTGLILSVPGIKNLRSRPLLNLPSILSNQEATVIVCEGEKAATYAEEIFQEGYVVTCSAFGAQSAGKTDWSSLEGRKVLIWPDHDKPGYDYAEDVMHRLEKLHCDVRILEPLALSYSVVDGEVRQDIASILKPGYDAADAVSSGWTKELVHSLGDKFLSMRIGKPQEQDKETILPMFSKAQPVANIVEVAGFEDGLYIAEYARTGEVEEFVQVGPELDLIGGINHPDINERKIEIHFEDTYVVVPMPTRPGDLQRVFFGYGYTLFHGEYGAKVLNWFMRRAHMLKDSGTIFSLSGWREYNKRWIYISSNGLAIGREGFLPTVGLANSEKSVSKGELDDWIRTIGNPAGDNQLMMLAISAALAPTLFKSMNAEGGILHIYGPSTTGKTTLARVFDSVWRKPVSYAWHSTTNFMEVMCKTHNDGGFVLDEIATAKSKTLQDVCYLVTNGMGRGRLDRNAEVRSSAQWRTMVLSTGEVSLFESTEERIEGTGRANRVLNINIGSRPYGAFDYVEGEPSKYVHNITTAANNYYGTAGRAFVSYLLELGTEAVRYKAAEYSAQFLDNTLFDLSNQSIKRFSERVALFYAAGRLAIDSGLVSWRLHELNEAMVVLVLQQENATKVNSTVQERMDKAEVSDKLRLSVVGTGTNQEYAEALSETLQEKLLENLSHFFVYGQPSPNGEVLGQLKVENGIAEYRISANAAKSWLRMPAARAARVLQDIGVDAEYVKAAISPMLPTKRCLTVRFQITEDGGTNAF